MPPVITATEYGIFTAVGAFPAIPLNTPAWVATTYFEHYFPPEQVGDDTPIPGVPGRNGRPNELDEWVIPVEFVVYGTHQADGTPYADALVGVRANLLYLRTNLLVPPGTADGLRPYEFHRLDGTVEGADVKVAVGERGPIGPTGARMTLRITVPAAMFS